MYEVSLPPQPVTTWRASWIKAAISYAENLKVINEFILNLHDKSQCVVQSQELLKAEVWQKILFYSSKFEFNAGNNIFDCKNFKIFKNF